jgi:uncharacterized protein (UPF0276 family)
MVGVGFRRPLARWIRSRPAEIGCLEITAEHFYDSEHRLLREVAGAYPLFLHGLGLSLGTPGALDSDQVERFAAVAAIAQPLWISEHIAFTRTAEVDLGHLNPLRPTRANLRIVADHARQLAARCERPLILENITSHLPLAGEMAEPDFLNDLCGEAGCGLLLDVTNLFINSRNHGFDPLQWLCRIDPAHIVQLHLVGFSRVGDRYEDDHAQPIQNELLELTREVVRHAPVRAMIIERDGNFPEPAVIAAELRELRAIRAQN